MRKLIISICILSATLCLLPSSAFAVTPTPTVTDFVGVEWYMDDTLDEPPWPDSLERTYFDNYISILCYSRTGDSEPEYTFEDLRYYDQDGILFGLEPSNNLVPLFDFNSGEWLTNCRYLQFDTAPTPIASDVFSWFYQNGVPTCHIYNSSTSVVTTKYPVTTFLYYDEGTPVEFRFSSNPFNNFASSISLLVSSGDIVFSEPFRTKSIDPGLGDGLAGLGTSNDNVVVYGLGSNSLPLSSASDSSLALYPAFSSERIYSTSITIYDSSGEEVLYSNTFTASGASPSVKLSYVKTNTIAFSIDGKLVDTFNFDPVYGFSTSPNSSSPFFTVGGTLVLGGTSSDTSRILYAVTTPPASDLPSGDATSWLGDLLSGFLGAEIFPDFSFSDLLVVCIAIGLLFTFLKIAI